MPPVNPSISKSVHVRKSLLVISGFLILFNIWGLPLAFGALQSYYTTIFLSSSSASAVSWIGTVQGFLLVVVGVPAGQLYDLGYFRHMAAGGSLLTTFGMFMLSLCKRGVYWQVMLAEGIAVGLGSGLLYVPMLAVVGEAFAADGGKGRAVAMGIVTSGVGIGGIVYTLAFSHLITIHSFGTTIRILGFIMLGTFLLAVPPLLFLSFKPTSTPQPQPTRSINGSTHHHRRGALLDPTALRDPNFLLFTATSFLIFLSYLIPLFFIPTYAEQVLHLSTQTSANLLALSAGTSTAGRILAALLIHRATTPTAAIVAWFLSAASSAILCLAWLAVHSYASFAAFTALYGFTTGGLISLPPAIFPATCCPSRDMLGTRLGMSWVVTGVAFLVGAPVGAAILGVHGWRGLQGFAGAVMAGGMVGVGGFGLFVRARRTSCS